MMTSYDSFTCLLKADEMMPVQGQSNVEVWFVVYISETHTPKNNILQCNTYLSSIGIGVINSDCGFARQRGW